MMGLQIAAAILVLALPALTADPTPPKTPYPCRLLWDEQRKCAVGECDKRVIARLRRECLRDGGRI